MTSLLQDHIHVLTRDHMRRTLAPEGTIYATERPLLSVLRGVVGNGSDRGKKGSKGRGSSAPVDLTALALWQDITTTAAAWHRRHCTPGPGAEPELAVKLQEVTAADLTPAESVLIQEQLETWINRIRGHLEPPVRLTLQGECPECGNGHISEDTDDGQVVFNPALVAYETHAECRACGATWAGPDMHVLADRLRTSSTQERTPEGAER